MDHLENTKGFDLRTVKYLVMDEADRILNMDFEVELDKILKVIPTTRKTFLFSATMTQKVWKIWDKLIYGFQGFKAREGALEESGPGGIVLKVSDGQHTHPEHAVHSVQIQGFLITKNPKK